MTPEEKQMLTELANKIAQTPAPERDEEAETFIRTHIGSRPDALYLMTQTVVIQNMALEHAKQELDQWKDYAAQWKGYAEQIEAAGSSQQGPARSSSGSFLGAAQANSGQRTYSPGPQASPAQQQAPPPNPAQPQYAQYVPQAQSAPARSGMSSFLGGAAKTAAGVAAGALAFEGIRSMFGGGHLGGFGGSHNNSGFLGGSTPEVINNYYDGPRDPSRSSVEGDLSDSNNTDVNDDTDSNSFDSNDADTDSSDSDTPDSIDDSGSDDSSSDGVM